jgi:hypothetical protein
VVRFPSRGGSSLKAKLKTIANAKIICMKHQIGLAAASFRLHDFEFKKRGRL